MLEGAGLSLGTPLEEEKVTVCGVAGGVLWMEEKGAAILRGHSGTLPILILPVSSDTSSMAGWGGDGFRMPLLHS